MIDCLVGRLNTALICSLLSKAPISDRLHGCPRSYRKQTALQEEHTTERHCHTFLLHAPSANGSIHISVRGNARVCPPSNLRQGAQLQPCQCLLIHQYLLHTSSFTEVSTYQFGLVSDMLHKILHILKQVSCEPTGGQAERKEK